MFLNIRFGSSGLHRADAPDPSPRRLKLFYYDHFVILPRHQSAS